MTKYTWIIRSMIALYLSVLPWLISLYVLYHSSSPAIHSEYIVGVPGVS